MKFSLKLKIAALVIMASASSLLAATAPHNFVFQWTTSDTGFTPTFLDITAAFGIPTSAATAVTSFEITTPNGVWTPTSFTPTGDSPISTPFWQTGSLLTVSGTVDAPVLTFNGDGANLDVNNLAPLSGPGMYKVNLETTSITGSSFFALGDAGGTSTGNWTPVIQDASAPEAANTLILFLIAAGGLAISQRVRAQVRS